MSFLKFDYKPWVEDSKFIPIRCHLLCIHYQCWLHHEFRIRDDHMMWRCLLPTFIHIRGDWDCHSIRTRRHTMLAIQDHHQAGCMRYKSKFSGMNYYLFTYVPHLALGSSYPASGSLRPTPNVPCHHLEHKVYYGYKQILASLK